jgi:hypothetical protein
VFVIVISFNVVIACLCLGAAWKIRQWQRTLRRWSQALTNAEAHTYRVLHPAPDYILMGQARMQQFHQQVISLDRLRQQLGHVYALIGLLQWIWGCQIQRKQVRQTIRTNIH